MDYGTLNPKIPNYKKKLFNFQFGFRTSFKGRFKKRPISYEPVCRPIFFYREKDAECFEMEKYA